MKIRVRTFQKTGRNPMIGEGGERVVAIKAIDNE